MANILVIDDEETILDIINTLLTEVGHTTSLANSGVSAIEHLTADGNCFDLVLLDLSMPEMNGLEVLESLREKEVELPKIIILTGLMEVDTYLKAKQLGACEYITKPFEFDTFLAIIANHVESAEKKE